MANVHKNDHFNFKGLVNKVGFRYNNPELYKTAFTHTTYANEKRIVSNERMEFLGDAILDFLVGEYLYLNFPNLPEGQLSKTRAKYVLAEANCEYAKTLGLDEFLLLGVGEEEQHGRTKVNILGDLFEAFLGALYLDHGNLDEVREILKKVVFSKIDATDASGFFKDYKSILQECIQAESRIGVNYVLEREYGPSHDKRFVISVYHENIKLGEGIGKSKKLAEQEAAKEALEKLAK